MQSTFPLALGDRVTIRPAHLSRHVLQGVSLNSEDLNVTDEKKHKNSNRPFVIKAKKPVKGYEDERQKVKEEVSFISFFIFFYSVCFLFLSFFSVFHSFLPSLLPFFLSLFLSSFLPFITSFQISYSTSFLSILLHEWM